MNELMENVKDPIVGGLLPTPEDVRDFSLSALGGQAKLDVPLVDFMVKAPLEIKNQGGTDMCTAYSLAAVSEDQEEVILDPGFVFAMMKRERGEYTQWGGDLRSGCKVATKVGFIEAGQNPDDFGNKPRNFIANWNNWKLDILLPLAQKHAKQSYFKVDGPFDTFDNYRNALWQNKDQARSIYTGCMWKPGWTGARGGLIPPDVISGGVGHAFKVCGQKIFDGKPYLIVQNSAGSNVGDNGLFYFSRTVVNREFNFGGYMFIDIPREVAEKLNDVYLGKVNQGFWSALWELIRNQF